MHLPHLTWQTTAARGRSWRNNPDQYCLPIAACPMTPCSHLRMRADLVEDCTRLDPFARPSFRDVLLRLKSMAGFADRPDMPPF